MKNKKTLPGLTLTAGLLLEFIGICSGAEHLRMISGICIGVGAMLFSLSLNKLYRLSYEKEFPEMVRQEKIEMADERNIQICNCAKAKTSNISRWIVIGLSWVNFLVNGPLWMTLSLIAVFVLIYILEWYYMDKYQRKM